MKSPGVARRQIALLVPALLAVASCDDIEWFRPHATPLTLSAGRPECPETWTHTTIPLWPDSDGKRTAASGSASSFTIPASGLGASGPITDIPEFHDCQKFIQPGNTTYDSLFAIFAAYSLDSIGTALQSKFEAVSWISSNASVATVSGTGVVTAVAMGSATIVGTSMTSDTRTTSTRVTVVSGVTRGALGVFAVSPSGPAPAPLHLGETLPLVPEIGTPTGTTLAVGEIYTYGQGYKPLWIGPNFSCLYVYFNGAGRLVGKIIPVGNLGTGATACKEAADPMAVHSVPELKVIRTAAAKNDLPAAARWDFDAVNKQYYVGIKCGDGWCEVGADGAVGPFTPSTPHSIAGITDPGAARVVRGKGWYDRQELAIDDAAGHATPSGIIGTVFPDPNLGDFDLAKYGHWTVIGYVALDVSNARAGAADHYKKKFNYDPVLPGSDLSKLNIISLCFGSRFTCGLPAAPPGKGCGTDHYFYPKHVWIKIKAAGSDRVMYRCGIRRDHSGVGANARFVIPTARWRWLAADETIWEYCSAYGCCETAGNKMSEGW